MTVRATRRLALALIGLCATPVLAAPRDDKAPVVLFGVEIAKATRAQMRAALRARQVKVKREDDSYWYDVYDAHGLLDGATELAVGYTRAGRLGDLFYRFPPSKDLTRIQHIAAIAQVKYGKPDISKGQLGVGPIHYQWLLPDKVKVTVAQGWPLATNILAYLVYPHVETLYNERQSDAEQNIFDRAVKQSDHF